MLFNLFSSKLKLGEKTEVTKYVDGPILLEDSEEATKDLSILGQCETKFEPHVLMEDWYCSD